MSKSVVVAESSSTTEKWTREGGRSPQLIDKDKAIFAASRWPDAAFLGRFVRYQKVLAMRRYHYMFLGLLK